MVAILQMPRTSKKPKPDLGLYFGIMSGIFGLFIPIIQPWVFEHINWWMTGSASVIFAAGATWTTAVHAVPHKPPRVRRIFAAVCAAVLLGIGGYATWNQYHADRAKRINTLEKLKKRTDVLAGELLDFIYAREGNVNTWKNQAVAQMLIDRIEHRSNGIEEFKARLDAWNKETDSSFINFYWPQVTACLNDLNDAGVDISPVSRASADGPRKVGLMLSMVSQRIGLKSPYPRILTATQVKSAFRGVSQNVEVYAYLSDPNSKQVAETIINVLIDQGHSVNKSVYALPTQIPMPHGIHMVLPSGDLELNLEGTIRTFWACEIEYVVDVRQAKQPPTIVKIEVWPALATPDPTMMNSQLLR